MMTLADLILRLRRRDANAQFAETELRTTVPEALEQLYERVRLLEKADRQGVSNGKQ